MYSLGTYPTINIKNTTIMFYVTQKKIVDHQLHKYKFVIYLN